MKAAALILAAALVGCVDSSTGTGSGSDGSGASSTDPTGSWNATQYTFTSTTDASQTIDLVARGYKVSLVLTADGKATSSIGPTPPAPPGGWPGGTFSVVGTSIVWLAGPADTVAKGSFSRNGNSMTMDLTGKGVTCDLNGDAVQDKASLHMVLIALAH